MRRRPSQSIALRTEVLERRELLAYTVFVREMTPGQYVASVSMHPEADETSLQVTIATAETNAGELGVKVGPTFLHAANGDLLHPDSVIRVEVGGSEVDDTILASALSVPLRAIGGRGDDRIVGGSGPNVLFGGEGNDNLKGGEQDDTIYGDEGHDQLEGMNGNDFLMVGSGCDAAYGGDGKDWLQSEDAACTETDREVTFDGGGTDGDVFRVFIPTDSPTELRDVIVTGGGGDDHLVIVAGSSLPQFHIALKGGFDHVGLEFEDTKNNFEVFTSAGAVTVNITGHVVPLPDIESLEFLFGDDGDNLFVQDVPLEMVGVYGGRGNDTMNAFLFQGEFWAHGWGGSDTILGAAGGNRIYGGDGDDILFGGAGDDTIHGEAGSDEIHGEGGDDLLFGRIDLSDNFAWAADPSIVDGHDYLYGGDGEDELHGGDGDDELFGGDGDDQIYGFWSTANIQSAVVPVSVFTDGSDRLEGEAGDDELYGFDGADVYVFGPAAQGDDTLFESPYGDAFNDSDTLDFSTFDLPISLNLGSVAVQEVKPGVSFRLDGSNLFENVIGSAFDDRIRGNSRPNRLEGRKGSDILMGEADSDTIFGDAQTNADGGDGTNVLIGDGFRLSDGDWEMLTVDLSSFLASSVLNVSMELQPTGSGSDTITGGSNTDLIVGGDGSDTINTGDGPSLVFGDSFQIAVKAQAAFTLDMATALTSLSLPGSVFGFSAGITLQGNGRDTITVAGGGSIVLGGDGDDTIIGGNKSDYPDFLFGNDGEDHIRGQAGFNFIVGGDGDDPELTGGSGLDIIIGDSLGVPDGAMVTSPAAASLMESSSILRQFANLFGFAEVNEEGTPQFYDTAFGFKIVDTGDDVIQGGDGINLLFGGPGDDNITGGNKEDVIYGGLGDDAISGMNGVDLLVGGLGDDTLLGGNDSEANFLFGDVVTVGLDFDLSPFFSGDLTKLKVPKLNITLLGAGSDTISGGVGFDLIVGGKGEDELSGQVGDDTSCDNIITCKNHNLVFGDDFSAVTAVIDFAANLINPVKSAVASLVVDVIKSAVLDLYNKLFDAEGQSSIQNGDTYHGGDGHDIVLGGDGEDTLFGNGGSDFLIGGAGKDRIFVGNAPDTNSLYGVYGDLGWGGDGDDEFYGGNGNDVLASDQGRDHFYGGAGNDVLSGGGDDDFLYGEDGDDCLFGDAGNDLLDGGPGADRLFGGSGDDIFITDGDDVVEDRLPGDTDGDGDVDLVDLNNVRNNFGYVGTDLPGDVTGDGTVGLDDLNAVRNNFGSISSPTAVKPQYSLRNRKALTDVIAPFEMLHPAESPRAKGARRTLMNGK